jgi:hypothetical protein
MEITTSILMDSNDLNSHTMVQAKNKIRAHKREVTRGAKKKIEAGGRKLCNVCLLVKGGSLDERCAR